jgi:hypothetical protein
MVLPGRPVPDPEVIRIGDTTVAADAPRAWDLRCLIRERLVDYLVRNHPGALPRVRDEVIVAGADAG